MARVKRIEIESHGPEKGYTVTKHFEQNKNIGNGGYMEPETSAHSSHAEVMEHIAPHMDSDCVGTETKGKMNIGKNLTKHGYEKGSSAAPGHSKAHPGFKAVANKIASKEGVSHSAAAAILAARSRGASAAAHKANPRLNRVKG